MAELLVTYGKLAASMNEERASRILFLVNKNSGTRRMDRYSIIEGWLRAEPCEHCFVNLPARDIARTLSERIHQFKPSLLVAVGGDGTVTLAAEACIKNGIPLGIIPAGSANGMARELGIPEDCAQALNVIRHNRIKRCDAVMINDSWLCLHLCDMGLNARMIKYFDKGKRRGMLGYAIALVKAIRNRRRLKVMVQTRKGPRVLEAVMVIVANASKYGTGATINPAGSIDDGFFEVVIVKKIAVTEILKMFGGKRKFNPEKIETCHATSAVVESSKAAHFQVDGEFIGKLKSFKAKIFPAALSIVVPE
jgi:diacylglycerol kinase (ATP)